MRSARPGRVPDAGFSEALFDVRFLGVMRQVWLIQRQLNDPGADDIGVVADPLRFEQKGFRLLRGHAGKKLLETVADK
jgi:hypothetical protein